LGGEENEGNKTKNEGVYYRTIFVKDKEKNESIREM